MKPLMAQSLHYSIYAGLLPMTANFDISSPVQLSPLEWT